MNTYRYSFSCTCPSDGSSINYSLEIRSDKMVRVEGIVSACEVGESYHEDLADELHKRFGGSQTLTAVHGLVHITTERS